MADRLETYRQKRDFKKTAEPAGVVRAEGGNRYLIQKHDATRLHYDFRLELHGVLLSWAVTRGPSMDPADKRLAVHVEDHPLDYGDFEGTIPKGEYGGGTVMLWDEGTWEPVGDPDAGMAKGELKIVLHGERLKGKFVLIRLKPRKGERSKHTNWLLIKERDEYAGPEKKPITERATTSVKTGRTMEEIAAGNVEWTRRGRRFKEADGNGADDAAPAVGKIRPRPAKPKAGARRGAARGEPPKFVPPELATLVEEPPEGDGWIHEIKFDGYRLICAVGGGRAITYTRKGLDWSARFHSLIQPLADLPCSSALLDGEAVVMDADGRSDFGALQVALGDAPGANGTGGRITYHVFDLLHLDGEDLRSLPVIERKEKLRGLLADQPETGPIFFSDHVVGHGKEFFEKAQSMKLEGIIAKRADSPYRSERSKAWLKIKTNEGQEFIIIGWQPSTVKKRPFSAILLATRDENKLVYRGRVGSGFSERTLDDLAAKFAPLETKTQPAEDIPADARKGTHWLKPELVAEIEFRGWTGDGYVRQGAFKGLRADKKPAEIVRERPADVAANDNSEKTPAAKTKMSGKASSKRAKTGTNIPKSEPKGPAIVRIDTDRDHGTLTIAGVRVTHPDRVMFAGEKITKRMLIDYYLSVADRILPHLADRPLSLVRFPDGAQGDGFYQKHASPGFPKELKRVRIKEKEKSEDYLYIADEQGLVAAVQMGALELHVWGSHVSSLEKPDRVVFDFDPDEAVSFEVVKDSAKEMRDRLKSIGLTSFAMTTGGKGIHVVVPLTPHHGWEDVKAFAEAMARTFAAENPDRYLAEMSKKARKGKIFIDYLRNGRGATAISPFSTRARKGAPIAWPVAWTALPKLASAHEVTVPTAAAALKAMRKDPWAGYFEVDQVLPIDKLRG
jgi:bifunctional non-homologous end joining protein LigD